MGEGHQRGHSLPHEAQQLLVRHLHKQVKGVSRKSNLS
jgi:hypothetical protein